MVREKGLQLLIMTAVLAGCHAAPEPARSDFHAYVVSAQGQGVVRSSLASVVSRVLTARLHSVRYGRDLDMNCRIALDACRNGQRLADPGQPFNGGCIHDPALPDSRLVVAGIGEGAGYVLLLSGGFISSFGIFAYSIHHGQVDVVLNIPVDPTRAADERFFRAVWALDVYPDAVLDEKVKVERVNREVMTFLRSNPLPTTVFLRD